MGPKQVVPQSGALFQQTLLEMINVKHPLVKLADVIDWEEIERTFGAHFVSGTGRPALRPRLVAGLLYLQHAYDCSDEVWTSPALVDRFQLPNCSSSKAIGLS